VVSLRKAFKYLALSVAALLLVAISCALAYRYFVERRIAQGRAIRTPDGINSVEEVPIGGIKQWIELRGESVKNPVLLFIHGGPGTAFMPMARVFQDPWEKYFTVVQWDQRGAGKTYSSNSKDVQRQTMNLERMNADTLEMVDHLRGRFGQEKIFVLGHSWGSILGLRLAHDHPELLHAYIGVGQATDARQNEVVLYKDTMEAAQRAKNKEAIQQLTSIAPYPSANITFRQIRIMRQWSGSLIGPPGAADSSFGLSTIFFAPEYSLLNDVDWLRGQFFSVDVLLGDLTKVNFADLGYDYRVPIFFLEGRHDPYTPASVAKEFFDKVNDPQKDFEWFEKSGHFPFVEESQRFTDILLQRVLPTAQGSRPQ